MIYTNSNGEVVRLGDVVGQGGEATVHRLLDAPDRLAKVYSHAVRQDYPQKLAWMLAHPPGNPTAALGHPSLAWPEELIYAGGSRLAGYTMVHIQKAAPLVQVFNPRLRRETLPGFNTRYLHRAARNLSAALSALHSDGYVVGDLNESNILVTPSALVTMIDVDSFQVIETGSRRPRVHYCPVGKAEYTAPELHGKPLDRCLRLSEHDAFALGVLIFQLLMEGNHPFRAQWVGRGEPPPLESRIAMGAYPYVDDLANRKFPVRPPRNAPELNRLHPLLVELMRRCFADGHRSPALRPTAADWGRALAAAEAELCECERGHIYSGHLADCPICISAPKQPDPASRAAPRRKPEAAGHPSMHGTKPGGAAPGQRPFGNPQPAPSRSRPQAAATGGAPPPGPGGGGGKRRAVSGGLFRWVGKSALDAWQQTRPGSGSGSGASPRRSFSQAFILNLVRGRQLPGNPNPPAPTGAPTAGSGTSGGAAYRPASHSGPGSTASPARPAATPAASGGATTGFGQPGSRTQTAPNSRSVLPVLREAWKSLTMGSGFGALAGVTACGLLALGAGALDVPLGWILLLTLGGALGGVARGWHPGYRSGEWITIHIGWKRFLEIAGAISGAGLGFTLTLPAAWLICPPPIGLAVGGWSGYQLARRLWQKVGYSWHWERIWAGFSSAFSAAVCALIVRWLGEVAIGSGLARVSDRLLPWILVETDSIILVWLATGALAGAVGGAVAGFLTDVIARTFGLVK